MELTQVIIFLVISSSSFAFSFHGIHRIVIFRLRKLAFSSQETNDLKVPVIFDSMNDQHRDIRYHPEQPARIQKCVEALHKYYNNSLSTCPIVLIDVAPDPSKSFPSSGIQHVPFTDMELIMARSILVKAHSESYISNLESICRRAKQRRIEEGKNPLGFLGYVDADTFLTTETYDVCLRATATWIRCVNTACNKTSFPSVEPKTWQKAAFALTRPPGHHATREESNGFCFFNFAVAAAIYALESGLARKVSILDWDVHYGQGVADIVQHYSNIRYVSIHQSPAFPYQGNRRETIGEFKNVLTIPIPPDSSWSCGYQTAFQQFALPFIIQNSDWEPDLVVVCAGYDALLSDELASCNLNANDYGVMMRLLKEKMEGFSTGLVFGLEGGYQLEDHATGGNLADAVIETMQQIVIKNSKED